jgi:hypothetical protein
MAWKGNPPGWKKNQDQSSAPKRDWQAGAGGLLLVAAVHETGLLAHLETAIAPYSHELRNEIVEELILS